MESIFSNVSGWRMIIFIKIQVNIQSEYCWYTINSGIKMTVNRLIVSLISFCSKIVLRLVRLVLFKLQLFRLEIELFIWTIKKFVKVISYVHQQNVH